MSILIDSRPLVALINKRDQWHQWVTNRVKEMKPPFITCEAVLSECTFLLGRSGINLQYLFNFIRRGDIQVKPAFINERDQQRVIKMITTYQNLTVSFADACLVQMAESTKKSRIFTLDSDFTIYRTSEGNTLTLVSPFQF